MYTDKAQKILEKEMNKINKNLMKSLNNYRKTVTFMIADAPIGVLCLPKAIESILIGQDCLRVYDLLDRDLTKIKGLGSVRLEQLTSSLNQFLAMN
jgi:hypothetical protein